MPRLTYIAPPGMRPRTGGPLIDTVPVLRRPALTLGSILGVKRITPLNFANQARAFRVPMLSNPRAPAQDRFAGTFKFSGGLPHPRAIF